MQGWATRSKHLSESSLSVGMWPPPPSQWVGPGWPCKPCQDATCPSGASEELFVGKLATYGWVRPSLPATKLARRGVLGADLFQQALLEARLIMAALHPSGGHWRRFFFVCFLLRGTQLSVRGLSPIPLCSSFASRYCTHLRACLT